VVVLVEVMMMMMAAEEAVVSVMLQLKRRYSRRIFREKEKSHLVGTKSICRR
jgi:hypothetical protein